MSFYAAIYIYIIYVHMHTIVRKITISSLLYTV